MDPLSRLVLRVPVFLQSPSSCGPTSLKSVLWFHRRRQPIDRVARLCRLTDEGTDHAGLIDGALAAGARVFEREGGTLEELAWFSEQGLPPIVGWWSLDQGDRHLDQRWSLDQRRKRDCGHYSVCRGIAEGQIWLMDPQWRRERSGWLFGNRTFRLPQFQRSWYDTDTPRYLRTERWYMVVHFGRERFARRFPGGKDHVRRAT